MPHGGDKRAVQMPHAPGHWSSVLRSVEKPCYFASLRQSRLLPRRVHKHSFKRQLHTTHVVAVGWGQHVSLAFFVFHPLISQTVSIPIRLSRLETHATSRLLETTCENLRVIFISSLLSLLESYYFQVKFTLSTVLYSVKSRHLH